MAGSSTILRGTVRSNKANRQLKFIIGGVIVVALIALPYGTMRSRAPEPTTVKCTK